MRENAAAQISARTGSNASYQWSPLAPGTSSSTANGLNQYTASGGASLSYDGRGNLTNAGGVSFGYDIYNRMISAPSSVSFSYDPAGRLYEISAASATRFLYDGASIIAEYDTSGNVLRRYVHGLSGPMVWYEGAGTSSHRWLIPDERGSIIARDNAGAVSINTYDEYGQNGSSNAGRFQYVGLPWIAEAGLYQMGARAYSPSLGRWMQTDPILTAGGVNLYAYVGNDPVNLFDPSGLEEVVLPGCSLDACPTDDGVVVTAFGRWCAPGAFCLYGQDAVDFLRDQNGPDLEPGWQEFLEAAPPPAAIFEILDPGRPLSQCEAQAMADGGVPADVIKNARLHSHGPPWPMLPGYSVTTPRNWLGGGDSGTNVYLGTNSPSLSHLGHEVGGHGGGYARGSQSFWGNVAELPAYPNGPGEQEALRTQAQIEAALGSRTCPQN